MAPAPHSSTKRPPAQRPRGSDGNGRLDQPRGRRSSSENGLGSFGRRVSWCRDWSVRCPPGRVRPAPRSGSFGVGPPGFVWRRPAWVRLAAAAWVRLAAAAWVRWEVCSGTGIRLPCSAWAGSGSFGIRALGFVRCRPTWVRSGAPDIRLAPPVPARLGFAWQRVRWVCLACIHLGSFGVRSVAAI
jgi:hypothetical protein